jgi:glyoxylase-like metal-dependent hydrolase (beta-lactamase superfamily II)
MYFKQVKQQGDNFSYIIADETSKEAAVVDPSFNGKTLTKLLKDQNFTVKYVIDTHEHGDHTTDNQVIKLNFEAKIVAYKSSRIRKDISVDNGDTLVVGKVAIKTIHTPGHTPDGICLLVDDKILTGDTLFVGECGRTDLPGGSPKDMYNSLFQKLMKLDDHIEVYPGHDYGSAPHSTIGIERKKNYVLQPRSIEEFLDFMSTP